MGSRLDGVVHDSIFDALANRVFGRHLYQVTGLEGKVYVWSTQPLYAQNAAMRHWGARVSDPSLTDTAALQQWWQSLTDKQRTAMKELLNEETR